MASLVTVKSCVTIGQFLDDKCMAPWDCCCLARDFSACTVDTSMITVSSCAVKLQLVLSGWERNTKTLGMHVYFCGFSFIHSLLYFHLGCNLSVSRASTITVEHIRTIQMRKKKHINHWVLHSPPIVLKELLLTGW